MKVISRQTRITTVYDDGTSYEYERKTIVVEVKDEMSLDDAHTAIAGMLCAAKKQQAQCNS